MSSTPLSDVALAGSVAEVVRRPRSEPADSFVLHAPLELAARLALLPRVAPEHREAARQRIGEIASEYEAFAPAIPEPTVGSFDSTSVAAAFLGDAIDGGDLDDVDRAATWLGRVARPGELRALLADSVLPRLAAAAHAPIFLYQMPRIAPRGELACELLRPLARELAHNPSWRLTWRDTERATTSAATPDALFDALSATPSLGIPGSDFIFPLMWQAQESGACDSVLGGRTRGLDVGDARHAILRAAALSMLLEPDDHAPYGWSHCLTMPQAVLGIAPWCADPSDAIAIAATYVVGFRSAMATGPLHAYAPNVPGLDLSRSFETEPAAAAAAAWHEAGTDPARVVTEIASRAAVHSDAHLVKYTLACIDAAADDRDHARLYLAAAASLVAYWAMRGVAVA